MFDGLNFQDAPPIAVLKKAIKALLVLCAVTAAVSGYRAYFQVYSVELHLAEPVLRSGSVIRTEAVCSGRTLADVRLELSQGGYTKTLAMQYVPPNDWASFDPRPQRASQSVTLTPELLAGFRAGMALLRATATGRPQRLRLPPPLVRESVVEIQQ